MKNKKTGCISNFVDLTLLPLSKGEGSNPQSPLRQNANKNKRALCKAGRVAPSGPTLTLPNREGTASTQTLLKQETNNNTSISNKQGLSVGRSSPNGGGREGASNRQKIIFTIIAAIIVICACNKSKLDLPALGALDESKLTNKRGVERLLIGAYALLDGASMDDQGGTGGWGAAASNWIYGSICGSEAYTGSQQTDLPEIRSLESFRPTATLWPFGVKWGAVYAGVQRANTVLRVMREAKDLSPDDTTEFRAEALFLRGHYHFEAVKLWHKVPFVDETITYNAGNYYVKNDTIWTAIENDFRYAMNHLPATQPQIGRANKYAAKAFLAKVYLFEHKYVAARALLQDLIANGVTAGGKKYALVNYADNFNPATKNSAESVFAVQMSVNDGAFGANGNAGDELNFPYGGGPGGCCGFFQPSQYLVNHFKTDAITGLPDLENFSVTDIKSDTGLASAATFTPYTGTLDPRLDWTVGRRGIPYLDWGNHPGKDWVRDQNYSGPYSPKKNVYYKNQQEHFSETSNGWDATMLTANNVNLIRFADILLWAAEVEVEIGDLNKAREYVNLVRRRAGDPSGWVHTYVDPNDPSKGFTNTPAANYKIGEYTQPWTDQNFARKAVRYERMLELAMEGHRFFDLVRWGIADIEINAYLQKEQQLRSYLHGTFFTKNKNEYFPIPQSEIDKSAGKDGKPMLVQNPGY